MAKPLRILQVANRASPLYLFMLPLCRALVDKGASVELACMSGDVLWDHLNKTGYKVHPLPQGRWSNPFTYWRVFRSLRSLLRENHYDLMLVHTPAMSWVARPAAHKLVGRNIYFAHGLTFAPEQSRLAHIVFRLIERFIARYTDGIIVINNDDLAACKKIKLTREHGNYYYVPGVGVDVDKYRIGPDRIAMERVAEKLGLRADKPMILFLARFIKNKRPGDILELARRLGPEADFVLAGEGPLWQKIRDEADKIGTHVKVIEFTDQVDVLVALCSVLVLPSVFREGLPRVLLEAHAAGKPAVAYDIRGVRDVIKHGKTGFLAKYRDFDQLCDYVTRIIHDEKLKCNFGRCGQKRVQEKFSLEASLSELLRVIFESSD
jgi:glycosyltransferase involved in cell wall biosynthesis